VAAADVDRGPAQALDLLGAEHQVEPAAERVAVDQQRSVAAAHGCDRERGGEDRGTRAAAPAHDRDGRAAAAPRGERLRRLGEHPDQPGLAIRQGDDVRGADGHRVPPDVRWWLGPHHDQHVVAARQACLATAEGRIRVEHDHGSVGPAPARLERIQHPQHLAARRRGQPEHAVEEIGLGHHHEPAPARIEMRRVRGSQRCPAPARTGATQGRDGLSRPTG